MGRDAAYADQTPVLPEIPDPSGGSRTAEDMPTLVGLLSQDTTKKADQERVVKGLNQLLSNDTNTSSPYLPILDILGIKPSDLGNGAGGGSTPPQRQGDSSGGNTGRTTETDSTTEARDTASDTSSSSSNYDDEPAAVRKNREKYNGGSVIPGDSNPPGPYTPDVTPNRPDNRPPDDVKPEVQMKARYETGEIEEAVRIAKENNLPLVVHVGASWCGPCRGMENNAWPGVERDGELNKKAVYLHIDVDQAKELGGAAGELATQITDGVNSLPTVKVMRVGEQGLNHVDRHEGAMGEEQLKNFIRGNLK